MGFLRRRPVSTVTKSTTDAVNVSLGDTSLLSGVKKLTGEMLNISFGESTLLNGVRKAVVDTLSVAFTETANRIIRFSAIAKVDTLSVATGEAATISGPGTLSIQNTSYTVPESSNLSFNITRGNGDIGQIRVTWTIAISEANPVPVTGTVTFNDRDSVPKNVVVALGAVTTNRNGTITLSNPENLSGGTLPTIATPQATLLVQNITQTLNAPFIAYTDLTSGPASGGENGNGAYVRLFGKRLVQTTGALPSVTLNGVACTVITAKVAGAITGDCDEVVVQVMPSCTTGNFVLTPNSLAFNAGQQSNGVPFTVRSGRIRFLSPSGSGNGLSPSTPMSATSFIAGKQAGDIAYMLAGSYTGQYDGFGWGANFALNSGGTATQPLVFSAYPGAVVSVSGQQSSFKGYGGSGQAHWVEQHNMQLPSTYAIHSAINASTYALKSGVQGWRTVNCDFDSNYGNTNVLSGPWTAGNDDCKCIGNLFRNFGTGTPINNNHAVYIQCGASNVEVAWNRFQNLALGHIIQFHNDGPAWNFTNCDVHHNIIVGTAVGNTRGINAGNVAAGSLIYVYNNAISDVGQDFSTINNTVGVMKSFNNTLLHADGFAAPVQFQFSPTAAGNEVKNNIIYVDSSSPAYIGVDQGASLSGVSISRNNYFNKGNGPAVDATALNADPGLIAEMRPGLGSAVLNQGLQLVYSRSQEGYDLDGISRSLQPPIGAYVGPITNSIFPLSVAPGGRYLQTKQGLPFYINGEAVWSLPVQCTRTQIDTVLDTLASNGVTGILITSHEHYYSDGSPAWRNKEGNLPFTNMNDWSTPNESYWQLMDYIIGGAKNRNMAVIITPAYLGYQGGVEGWNSTVQAMSNASLQAYGTFFENRYGSYGNVIYAMGGDYAGSSTERAKQWNFVTGARSVNPNILVTGHGDRTQSAYSQWSSFLSSGFNLNCIYTDGTEYTYGNTEYGRSPPMPYINFEGYYLGATFSSQNTTADMIRQFVATTAAGGCGHIRGANPLWDFGSAVGTGGGPAAAISGMVTPSLTAVKHWGNFLKLLPWWRMVPKQDASLVTTSLSSGTTRILPMLSNDSLSAYVWVPTATSITMVMTNFKKSTMRVRWFDVTNGTYTTVGNFANTGTQTFTHPGNNSLGGSYRILVVD